MGQRRRIARSASANYRRLRLESLEERRLLAALTVTTNLDVVDLADGELSLREAIFVANTVAGPDTINFDFGHDGPETIVLTQGELAITDSLAITGAGAALLTIDASGNDPTPDSTLVDGDDTNDGDGSRTFNISDGNTATQIDVTIEGMTITGGDILQNGGGILSVERTTLSGVVLRQNQATNYGGGIHQGAESLVVVGSQLTDNHATLGIVAGGGGAISLRNAALQVENSTISGNSGRTGGGIFIREGVQAVSINNSHVDGNSTRGGGAGGIWRNGEMPLEIINSTVDNNVSSGRGGGMEVLGRGVFLLEDSSVSGNTANGQSFTSGGGGGIVFESNSEIVGDPQVIRRSQIANNHAVFEGGGLHLNSATKLLIEESEISGNTADGRGGGIYARRTNSLPAGALPLQIYDSRIVGNGSMWGGNAIHLAGSPFNGQFGHGTAAILESSEISGNQHLGYPQNNLGAIYALSERLSVIDTVISGNYGTSINFKTSSTAVPALVVTDTMIAAGSGGIRSQGGAVQLTNSTITGSFGNGVHVSGATLSMAGGEILSSHYAGILVENGDVSVTNANIEDNQRSGIAVQNGQLILTSSEVRGNSTTVGGGGINLTGASTHTHQIRESTISDNRGGQGGGVYSSGDLYIADSIIAGNQATNWGGGIGVQGPLTLLRSAVFGNQTTGANQNGGGIAAPNSLAVITIQDTSVSNNSATGWGGAIFVAGTSQITRSNLVDNSAVTRGGAIFANSRPLTMTDSTVARNRLTGSMGIGGGIAGTTVTISQSTISGNTTAGSSAGGISASQLTLNQCTVTDNHALSATAIGGGIVVGDATQLNGSIVAGNSAAGGNPDVKTSTFSTPTYSLIGNTAGLTPPQINVLNAGAGNLLNQNPWLGPLADHGGPEFADGSKLLTHALLAGSPAIDAGDPSRGPVAMYRFEEAAGATTIEDVVGGQDGTYHGGVALEQAPSPFVVGHSALFDGVGDYATVPATVANSFSFSLWVKTAQPALNGVRIGLVDADAVNAVSGFGLYIESGRIVFRTAGASLGHSSLINDNIWHHVAVTRNATTGSRSLYLDGVLRSEVSGGVTVALTDVADWQIGRLIAGAGHFDGSLDELAVYDRVLTVTEIARLAAGTPEFDQRGEPHLRFLDGDGAGGARIDMGAYERAFGETYTFVVDTLSDESDGDYSLGDFSLREAIELANANPRKDTIEFDEALWAEGPARILLTMGALHIQDTATLHGPSAELLTIDASGSDPTPNSTLTDGDDTNDGDGTAAFAILDVDFEDRFDVELSGITITGGDSPGAGAIGSNVALRLVEVVVSGNRSTNKGGAIAQFSGVLSIIDSVISHNDARKDGGGVFVFAGSLSVVGSVISNNTTRDDFGMGGGIAVDNILVATDPDAFVRIERSIISQNVARGTFAPGGISISSDTFSNPINPIEVTIVGSTISENIASGNVAGIYLYGAEATIEDSTVSSNRWVARGGVGGSVEQWRGGIFLDSSDLTLVRSTVVDNVGFGPLLGLAGNGIQVLSGNVVLDHSIVARNTSVLVGGDPADIVSSGLVTARSSLVGAAEGIVVDGSNIIGTPDEPIDPLLGPLAYNGGPVFIDGTRMFTHAPLPGSPAIDAGDPAAGAGIDGVPEFDQRGMPWVRVANGDDVPEARIDMGAVEAQANPLTGDYNFDGVVDAADYSVWMDTLGSTSDLRADGDGDGSVDADDYGVWTAQFGEVLEPGAGSRPAAQVPRQGEVQGGGGAVAASQRLAGDAGEGSAQVLAGSAVTERKEGLRRAVRLRPIAHAVAAEMGGDLLMTAMGRRVKFADEGCTLTRPLPEGEGDCEAVDEVFARVGAWRGRFI